MTIVPELEKELVDAVRRHRERTDGSQDGAGAPRGVARRLAGARRERRLSSRRRSSLAAVLLAGGLVLSAGIALAASGLLSGAPVHLGRGAPLSPRSDYGVPRPGGVHLLPIATPDPAGGPPWGARYVLSTRGVGCLQFGRLVRGQIGVIGKDGAFGDDGLFHPLPSDYLKAAYPCATVGRNGDAYAAVVVDGIPASALIGGEADNGGCAPEGQPRRVGRGARMPVCPRRDERLLMAGLAGPQAQRVYYRDEGRLRSVPAAAPYGAYLIVMPLPANAHDVGSLQIYTSGNVGGGRIVKIAYRGGRVIECASSGPAHQRTCPAVGNAPSTLSPLSDSAVKAPVSVTVGHTKGERLLRVSFKARVAVASANAGYWIAVHVPGPPGKCGYTSVGPVSRDVRAGEAIRQRFQVSYSCHGRFKIEVTYRRSAESNMFPGAGVGRSPGTQTVLVGRRTLLVP